MAEYRVLATMNGVQQDLTRYVTAMQWKHGQLLPNAFGNIMTPAAGLLTLRNHGQEFDPYQPASWVDPLPGSPITIESRLHAGDAWVRSFTGWTDFLHSTNPVTEQNTATWPLLGPLARVSEYHQRLFIRLDADLLSGAVIEKMLDDVGWTGGRTVAPGLTRLRAYRLNVSNALGSTAGRRVNLTDAAKVICQAEVGRMYDNRLGHIVFEDRSSRSYIQAHTVHAIDAGTGWKMQTLRQGSVRDSIINVISASTDSYTNRGIGNVALANVSLPYPSPAITIAPGDTWIFTFEVDTTGTTQFVQSWEDVVHTFPATAEVTVEYRSVTCRVTVRNPTSSNISGQVTGLRGERFGIVTGREIRSRVQASIDKYEERAEVYPINLVVDEDEQQDHLDFMVRRHSGIPPHPPLRRLTAQGRLGPLNGSMLEATISDIAEITLPSAGLSAAPFWIDEIEHDVSQDGDIHDITLKMIDLRSTAIWPLREWRMGVNTVVGF